MQSPEDCTAQSTAKASFSAAVQSFSAEENAFDANEITFSSPCSDVCAKIAPTSTLLASVYRIMLDGFQFFRVWGESVFRDDKSKKANFMFCEIALRRFKT